MRRWCSRGTVVVAMAPIVAAAVSVAPPLAARRQSDPPAFEMALVRESAAGQRMSFHVRPDRHLEIRGHNLRWLVARAYGVDPRRVLQGPDWSGSQRFDIEATWPRPGLFMTV